MTDPDPRGPEENDQIALQRRAFEEFDALVDLEKRERDLALEALQRENPNLASEVLKLLMGDKSLQSETDDAPAEPEPAEDTPESIDTFAVLGVLGRGASGTVYRCAQSQPKREVAIKVLHAPLADSSGKARFQREAELLAKLSHPNIAKVHEVRFPEGRSPYFVMEFVRGVSLDAFLRLRRPGFRARLEMFLQICDAVAHAHRLGVIHRDLKPSNILVEATDGAIRCCVIDFGVSLALDDGVARTRLTHTGAIVGTPQYMSPEQLTLIDSSADTRSDVYALGLVLYEMLVGAPAFSMPQHATTPISGLVHRVVTTEPPRATRTLETDRAKELPYRTVPREVDWITQCAMSHDPSERFQTVDAFANDVRALLRNEPVATAPPSLAYRSRKFYARNKALCLSAAATMVVLVAATVVSLLFAFEASEQSALARVANTELSRELMLSQYRELSLTIDRGEYDTALTVLDELEPHRGEWLWGFYDAIVRSHDRELASPGGPSAVAVSPDGKLTAVGSEGGLIRLLSGPDGPVDLLSRDSGRVSHLAWSDRSDLLLVVFGATEWSVIDVGTASEIRSGVSASPVVDCFLADDGTPRFVRVATQKNPDATSDAGAPRISLLDGILRVEFPGFTPQEFENADREIRQLELSRSREFVLVKTSRRDGWTISLFGRGLGFPRVIVNRSGQNEDSAALDHRSDLVHLLTANGTRSIYDWRSERIIETSWLPLETPASITVDPSDGSLVVADDTEKTRWWSVSEDAAFRSVDMGASVVALDPIGGVLVSSEQPLGPDHLPGIRSLSVPAVEWTGASYLEATQSWAALTFAGKFGLASGSDGFVVLKDLERRHEEIRLNHDRTGLMISGFSPQLVLCDPADPTTLREINTNTFVQCGALGPDGSTIAASLYSGEVLLYTPSGDVVHRFELDSRARSLAFADGGQTLLAGCEDGSVLEFSVTEQTLRATHQPHEEFVTRIISTGNGFITLARNERPKYTERSDRPFSVALPSLVDEPITFLNGDGETVMFGNHAGGVAIVRPRE